jgi:hypothetical protein
MTGKLLNRLRLDEGISTTQRMEIAFQRNCFVRSTAATSILSLPCALAQG